MITNTSCHYEGRCLLDPLSRPIRSWYTSSVTQWPKHLKNTNRPFCTLKMWALLTNKGQYLPLSAPRPPGGGYIGGADQIKNSWPDVGIKWTQRCHQNGNLSGHWYTGFCLVHPYCMITRGYKLLIITLQLWRMNQELWPCGRCSHTTIPVLFAAPQIERFHCACMQPLIV